MSTPLASVKFGTPVRYGRPGHRVLGDTWSCAWSDDDQVYCVIDDTAGFDLVLRPSRDRNVAIGSFGNSRPPELEGRIVNGLEACGRSNQLGRDGACWKGNGLLSVDGVLYLSVSRHWYHVKEYDHRQYARDASLLVSRDKGQTWSPMPYLAEPLPQPLFPGQRFATPFFLDVGRDSQAPSPAPHGTDTHIYALSNDGYWNNGNAVHLARVRRERLPQLELKDWEFFCGCRGEGAPPTWLSGKAGLECCYPILSRPYGFGQTGMNWLPAQQRYLLIGWHYPKLSREVWQHQTSVWDFYEAPAPWGPWTRFATRMWETEGYYNPALSSRFIDADGRRLWLLACGDFNTHSKDIEETLYTLFAIPVELGT